MWDYNSVSPIYILQKKKKDMIFVGLTSQANGKFKLHTVKALQLKLSWNWFLLSLLLFVSFLQVTI